MGQCIQRKVEDIDGILVVQVTYDCYRRRFGCLLGRSVLMNQAGDLVVIDMADSLHGHELMGYVHLSPQIQLNWDAENKNLIRATSDRDSRRLFFFNCAEVQQCQGWYCPAFGVRRRKPVLEYRGGKFQGSNWLAWTLTAQELPTIQSLSVNGHALSVQWGEWQSTIEFWPGH
jgi:Heparinase II/III-like protein